MHCTHIVRMHTCTHLHSGKRYKTRLFPGEPWLMMMFSNARFKLRFFQLHTHEHFSSLHFIMAVRVSVTRTLNTSSLDSLPNFPSTVMTHSFLWKHTEANEMSQFKEKYLVNNSIAVLRNGQAGGTLTLRVRRRQKLGRLEWKSLRLPSKEA